MSRTVFLVAGEASGDLHAASLLRCLRRRDPSLRALGIGGRHLAEAGLEVLVRSDAIATMGLTETFGSLRRVWQAYRVARATLAQERPDLVILVDYPEFNLRLARYAKSLGLRVFYYISPQVWAWRRGRVRKMRQILDRLAVVFPFEEELYNNGGHPLARFVGHPLRPTSPCSPCCPVAGARRSASSCRQCGRRPELLQRTAGRQPWPSLPP